MAENQEKWEKLAAYFAGKATAQEQKELEEWLRQASEQEKELYDSARKLWEKTALKEKKYVPDVDKGWERLQLKASIREERKAAFPYAKIAAAILVMVVAVFLLLRNDDPAEMINITADTAVELVALPDGSRVWLNRNSTLSFSQDYRIDHREVFLSGEAFFDVKKTEGTRFTILTDNTRTEVLGTSFNLKAVPGEPIKLQVTSGKVAFSALESNETVLLEPGQEAAYLPEKDEPIVKGAIEDVNYRAWQTKQLNFNNTSLKEIARTLEDYFGTPIAVQDELMNCRFTVSFNDPEIGQVLDVLTITGNFTMTKSAGGYVISGEGCN